MSEKLLSQVLVRRRKPRRKDYVRAYPVTGVYPTDAQIEARTKFAEAAKRAKGKKRIGELEGEPMPHAAEAEGLIKYFHALEIVCRELGVEKPKGQEVLQDLCREGFIRTVKTGMLQVRLPGQPSWPTGIAALFG